jgi:hypothetical protein
VFDYYGWPDISLQVVPAGGATFTVEQTLDNVLDPTVTPTWFPHPDTNLVGQTVIRQGNYAYLPAAMRVTQTGGGSVRLTALQAGSSPA